MAPGRLVGPPLNLEEDIALHHLAALDPRMFKAIDSLFRGSSVAAPLQLANAIFEVSGFEGPFRLHTVTDSQLAFDWSAMCPWGADGIKYRRRY